MLFLPSTVPWELSQDMFNEKVTSLKLEPSHNPTMPQSPNPTIPQSSSHHPATSHHISPYLQVTSVKLFVKRVFISESFEEHMHMHAHAHLCHIHAHAHVHVHVHVHVCMCVCMHMCMHMYVCMCVNGSFGGAPTLTHTCPLIPPPRSLDRSSCCHGGCPSSRASWTAMICRSTSRARYCRSNTRLFY